MGEALNHTPPPLESVLLRESSAEVEVGVAGVVGMAGILAEVVEGVVGGSGLMTCERAAQIPESCGDEGVRAGGMGTTVSAGRVEQRVL